MGNCPIVRFFKVNDRDRNIFVYKDERDRHSFLCFLATRGAVGKYGLNRGLRSEKNFSLVSWKLRGPKFGFYVWKFKRFTFWMLLLARKFKLAIGQVFINSPIFGHKLDFCPSVKRNTNVWIISCALFKCVNFLCVAKNEPPLR